ncbi:hypothetical protein AX16_006809 [Volvariella volvacea WC 439]|nr:hypothetical protein AX16_006809 [Volvariella volvacea WC 439]
MANVAHIAALSVGSNLGDRFYNIEYALRLLEAREPLLTLGLPEGSFAHIVNTSFMYETAPMYVTDQPSFINCACLIETNISATDLLRLVKHIEEVVGRVPSIRFGPRAIDLDIALYGDEVIDTRPPSLKDTLDKLINELIVPHPRMAEREFVLRPLNDMIPDYVHPVLQRTIHDLLNALVPSPDEPPMKKVIPFPRYPLPEDPSPPSLSAAIPPTHSYWTHGQTTKERSRAKTRLMATLNTTPDSFSDGSQHNTLESGFAYVQDSVRVGSSIVDIGGYSTRPGAAFVSTEEEISRVVPFVTAIRQGYISSSSTADQRVQDILISIDTFRHDVAEAAILAGANCINDVYAFGGSDSYAPSTDADRERVTKAIESMKVVARRLAAPVILMHSRGDAGQNKDYSLYDYAGEGGAVVEGVCQELGDRVESIIRGRGGIRRWLVIVDPGIGFSKSVEDNLALIKHGALVVAKRSIGTGTTKRRNPLAGYPTLVGVSRKSFIGHLLQAGEFGRSTQPVERDWATAAAITAAVQQGSTIIRAHNTAAMADVLTITDAIYGI